MLFVLSLGCQNPPDDCQRAIDRLVRIATAKQYAAPIVRATERMTESCRTGRYAAYDPVLRCAMDSTSDQAAADCIDRGIKSVLKPSDSPGSGINPLMSN